jgi:hypothetical protein
MDVPLHLGCVTSLSARTTQETPFLCWVCDRCYADELFTVQQYCREIFFSYVTISFKVFKNYSYVVTFSGISLTWIKRQEVYGNKAIAFQLNTRKTVVSIRHALLFIFSPLIRSLFLHYLQRTSREYIACTTGIVISVPQRSPAFRLPSVVSSHRVTWFHRAVILGLEARAIFLLSVTSTLLTLFGLSTENCEILKRFFLHF